MEIILIIWFFVALFYCFRGDTIEKHTTIVWCDKCSKNTFSYDGGKTCGTC